MWYATVDLLVRGRACGCEAYATDVIMNEGKPGAWFRQGICGM